MTDTLVHRGPDEQGHYVDRFAALGHRRLSIIDLGSGQQPMSAGGGRVQIVFNGEIYNFIDVRAELEAAGHEFGTDSDTEVILHAYLEWGERCVDRLNGMFAFAIWDVADKRLLLARDRVGKKPLYVYRKGSTVGFASELKALRAGGLGADEIDVEALDCYFSLGYIPAPRTIYSNVRKLEPARIRTVTASGETERQYWQLSFADPIERSLDDAVDEFEALLDEAVRCRLMSQVPLGAFLSGGLDSSLVVSSMSRLLDDPVRTHSIGFEEAQFSELSTAKTIAEALGTDHQEYLVVPKAADVLEKIAWHFDEPLADSSALPTWYVCEMTRRSVTVALSGDGGDEGFGGYTFRYLPHMFESRVRSAIPAALRAAVFGPIGSLWPSSARLPKPLRLKTIFENLAVSDAEAFCRDLVWLRRDTRAAIYRPEFMQSLMGFTPSEDVYSYYAGSDAEDALGRAQSTDINVYMVDDVLVKVDRMSMAHSLEVRSPLLDHRLLEFGARLPSALKIGSRQGKLPLRALAARRLPAEVQRLPKRGFSIPAAQWLRNELRELGEEMILNPGDAASAALSEAGIAELWREHQSGARDHSVFLWALMMLGLWERTSRADRPGRP